MGGEFGEEWIQVYVWLSPFAVHLILYTLLISYEVAQSHLALCDPMDCSLPGSSVQGIFQVRVLERVAISFPRGSSQPRD